MGCGHLIFFREGLPAFSMIFEHSWEIKSSIGTTGNNHGSGNISTCRSTK